MKFPKRILAAATVCHNWRLQTRLPLITAYAHSLGMDTDPTGERAEIHAFVAKQK